MKVYTCNSLYLYVNKYRLNCFRTDPDCDRMNKIIIPLEDTAAGKNVIYKPEEKRSTKKESRNMKTN